MPDELVKLFKDLEVNAKNVKQHVSDYPDRKFLEFSIKKNNLNIDAEIVIFKGEQKWDFVQVQFKGCIYQDLVKGRMIDLLVALVKGNYTIKKTLFTRREKIVVYLDGKSIEPYSLV